MRFPLLWLACFLSLGIWLGDFIQIPILFTVLSAVLFILISIFTFRRHAIFIVTLSVTFFLIGILLSQVSDIYPANHIRNFTPESPQEVYLEGVIIDEPQSDATSYGKIRSDFVMEAMRLQRDNIKIDVTGKVKVTIYADAANFNYGDRIVAKGLLSKPPGPQNPGQFDYSRYLRRKRIFALFGSKGQDALAVEKGKANPVARIAYELRSRISGIVDSNLPREKATFLNAILLGLRQNVDEEVEDKFVKTGTVHLMAISGLNVVLLASIIILILRATRIPYWASISAAIILLAFYAILTNGTASVVRATVMSIVVLVGLLIGRQASLWNSLGLAALIILGFEPYAIFDAGFQLSFLSVVSILYLFPRIEAFFGYDKRLTVTFMKRSKKYLIEAVFVSFAAWFGVLPVVLYYFNIVTPIAVVANLIAVPLSFLITASSIPFIVFGFFIPWLEKIFAASTWFLCDVLFGTNEILTKVPFAYSYMPKPPVYIIVLYYLFIIAFIEHRRLKVSPAKIMIIALIFINSIIWRNVLMHHDGKPKITFLSVGHGDSAFLEFPSGENMLIDTGTGADRDIGRSVILPFLRNKGIQKIDAVLLTHPDSDHIGGLASLIDGIKVLNIFDNGVGSKTDSYRRLMGAIYKRKINRRVLKRGDSIVGFKGIDLICFNPPAEWIEDPAIEDNDKSLVINIGHKQTSVLFCGDIGTKAMIDLIGFADFPKGGLIILPHHGQKLDSIEESFLDYLKPKQAVISHGRGMREVSFAEKTEQILESKGIKVFRTDRDGAIFAILDGSVILLDSFKSSD